MPRYFFHLHNDLDVPDEEGAEFPKLDGAIVRALRDAREMTALNVVEHGRINRHHPIEVADEAGQVVHTVEFGSAVTHEG